MIGPSGEWIDFETSVWWLETEGEEGLVERYETFRSVEERQEYIKARIDLGVVYDLLGWTESYYGGDPRLYPAIEETPENGFVLIPKKERKPSATNFDALYNVGRDRQTEEESPGDQREGLLYKRKKGVLPAEDSKEG